jgi:hypothetical protein
MSLGDGSLVGRFVSPIAATGKSKGLETIPLDTHPDRSLYRCRVSGMSPCKKQQEIRWIRGMGWLFVQKA